MKILFVHQNYPGQFLHLAPALATLGHEVAALTAAKNARHSPIRTFRYPDPAPVALIGPAKTYADAVERGLAAARGAEAIRRDHGFLPDVVFGHGGWGETLFLREVFPQARHLSYAEFHYRATGLDTGFDPEFQPAGLGPRVSVTARAAHLLQSVILADAAVAPTEWQASTFPPEARPKIRVIHDGIDTVRLRPDPAAELPIPAAGLTLRPGDEVISFVNRNIEPYRGAHIFFRALPDILAARPNARVVIVGGTEVSYGQPPPGGGSWKDRLWAEIADRVDTSRVQFLGRVPYPAFVALMQVTRVHAYLTYPFVLSWSLLEAMSAGASVIASRTPPVEEVIEDGVNGRLVDFFDVAAWSRALIAALADPGRDDGLRAAARAKIVADYDLRSVCLPEMIRFVSPVG
ncbi:MAG: glycosyltransferase [Paracoccaceae bacterium]